MMSLRLAAMNTKKENDCVAKYIYDEYKDDTSMQYAIGKIFINLHTNLQKVNTILQVSKCLMNTPASLSGTRPLLHLSRFGTGGRVCPQAWAAASWTWASRRPWTGCGVTWTALRPPTTPSARRSLIRADFNLNLICFEFIKYSWNEKMFFPLIGPCYFSDI